MAWAGLNLALFAMGLSLTDPDFAAIVAKPDNVPIVGLIFLLGFFTWLSARKAVLNDQRLAQGLPPLEAVDNEKVLVWPDLVYIELICMVALTAVLLVWSILLKAPLEEPASTVQTPNPSKAPWYFLGLQEMLVYFDPWMAGVVIPGLIIIGLIAIPYLDRNEKGNGYYTINERKFAYVTFQFGFLVLWIVADVDGDVLPRTELELLWILRDVGCAQGRSAQQRAAVRAVLDRLGWASRCPRRRREPAVCRGWVTSCCANGPGSCCWPCISVLARCVGPAEHGRPRDADPSGTRPLRVMMLLLLTMALLPIKMMCRWLFNLNYFVAIPEYFLNF